MVEVNSGLVSVPELPWLSLLLGLGVLSLISLMISFCVSFVQVAMFIQKIANVKHLVVWISVFVLSIISFLVTANLYDSQVAAWEEEVSFLLDIDDDIIHKAYLYKATSEKSEEFLVPFPEHWNYDPSDDSYAQDSRVFFVSSGMFTVGDYSHFKNIDVIKY